MFAGRRFGSCRAVWPRLPRSRAPPPAMTSRATWTATYRQHRALPQNFVSGRTSADSAKLESIAALRTTAPCSSTIAPKRVWLPDADHSAGTFGTIIWSCDDRAWLLLEEIGELLLGSNTGLGTRDVMDALPPARRDGRAPSVSRRRLLWAGSAGVAAIVNGYAKRVPSPRR
jgi:hypothetical protein